MKPPGGAKFQPPAGLQGLLARGRPAMAGAAAVFLFFRLLNLPKWAPDSLLDSSQAAALTYFRAHGLQFGIDALYTYGPLGYSMTGVFTGHAQWAQFAGAFAMAAFAAALTAAAVMQLPPFRALLLCAAVCFSGTLDSTYMALPAIAYVAVSGARRRRSGPLAALGAGLAFLSLVKFSFFLCSLAALPAIAALLWIRGERGRAAVFLSGFAVSYAVLWLIFGGGWRALPLYLKGSAEVAAGFGQTMYIAPPPAPLHYALACMALCLVIAALPLARRLEAASALNAAVWLGVLFLAWKHSFVRADASHLRTFFSFAPLFVAGPVAPALPRGLNALRWTGALAVLVLTASAAATVNPAALAQMRPDRLVADAWRNAASELALGGRLRDLRVKLAGRERYYDLGDWKTVVGSNPVDVFGQAQTLAILNHLNYRPRPSYQSFETYTPYLIRRNYEYFLKSPPPFLLFGLWPIDGRYPAQEDSLALGWILTNYAPLPGVKLDHFLLKRTGRIDFERQLRPIGQAEAKPGQDVAIPDSGGRPIWCRISLRKPFWSSLRQAAYQPEDAQIRIDFQDRSSQYRFLRGPGESGFIISPLLTGMSSMAEYLCGVAVDRPRSVRIEGAALEGVSFRFYAMPPPQPVFRDSGCASIADPMPGVRALSIEGDHAYAAAEGKRLLFAHAPSAIRLDTPQGARRLSGFYGFGKGVSGAPRNAGGIVFRIAAARGNGKTEVLWESWLRPLANPADDGMHPFSVILPDGAEARLEAAPGLKGNPERDWAVWADLEFAPVGPVK